jgi:hypothetical protein
MTLNLQTNMRTVQATKSNWILRIWHPHSDRSIGEETPLVYLATHVLVMMLTTASFFTEVPTKVICSVLLALGVQSRPS